MATLTIRNIDETTKRNLRLHAAKHGCSMEEEARRILREALASQDIRKGLGSRIHQRFSKIGGFDMPLALRSMPRQAPNLTTAATE
jgi:plasmid stability protein